MGIFAYFMDLGDERGSGTMLVDPAELMVTSVWPLVASEAGYGDVPDETLSTFSFYCQCLHAVFALFTLKHHTTGHWAPEEKLPSL